MGKNKHKKYKQMLRAQMQAHRHAIEHGHDISTDRPAAPQEHAATVVHAPHHVAIAEKVTPKPVVDEALTVVKKDIRFSVGLTIAILALFAIIYYLDRQYGVLLPAARKLFGVILG